MSMKVPPKSDTSRVMDAAVAGAAVGIEKAEPQAPRQSVDGSDSQVPPPWSEKKKLQADEVSGTPSPYPKHLEAIFAERPDLETRWQRLHTWLADPKQDAVESARYETYEAINEDRDMPKLHVMLTFLHGQLGGDGLKAFVSETVTRLADISGKQDARTLLEQWPTQRWGELPDRAALEALAQ